MHLSEVWFVGVFRLEPPIQVRQVGVSHIYVTNGWLGPNRKDDFSKASFEKGLVGWLVGWLVDINISNKPLNIFPAENTQRHGDRWMVFPHDFSGFQKQVQHVKYRLKKAVSMGGHNFGHFPVRGRICTLDHPTIDLFFFGGGAGGLTGSILWFKPTKTMGKIWVLGSISYYPGLPPPLK